MLLHAELLLLLSKVITLYTSRACSTAFFYQRNKKCFLFLKKVFLLFIQVTSGDLGYPPGLRPGYIIWVWTLFTRNIVCVLRVGLMLVAEVTCQYLAWYVSMLWQKWATLLMQPFLWLKLVTCGDLAQCVCMLWVTGGSLSTSNFMWHFLMKKYPDTFF